MSEEKYRTPQEKIEAVATAEALSRRDESVANVLAGRSMRMGRRAEDYDDDADKMAQAATETAKKEQELREMGVQPDLSGTWPTLSDSEGNYAPNIQVARTGGTGVAASNTAEGGGVADDPESVDLTPVGTGITAGNQPIGEAAENAEVAQPPSHLERGEPKAADVLKDNEPATTTSARDTAQQKANEQKAQPAAAKAAGNAAVSKPAAAPAKKAEDKKADPKKSG